MFCNELASYFSENITIILNVWHLEKVAIKALEECCILVGVAVYKYKAILSRMAAKNDLRTNKCILTILQ